MPYKLIRDKYKLTRLDIAEMFEVEVYSVGRWERNECQPKGPTEILYYIMDLMTDDEAKALDVPRYFLRYGARAALRLILREAA